MSMTLTLAQGTAATRTLAGAGPAALSDAELLAIFLRVGTPAKA
jgi:DNA repair protein RadC